MKKNKHYKFLAIIGLTIGVLSGCGGTKSAAEIALNTEKLEAIKNDVASKSYSIEVHTAYPTQTYAVTQITNALMRNTGNSASRIDVTGNSIKVKGDTIQGILPYIGEVRAGSPMSSRDVGIEFKGQPISYKVIDNNKRQTLDIEFQIKDKIERYDIIIQIYPDKSTTILVNCRYRTSIRYDGTFKVLPPENHPSD